MIFALCFGVAVLLAERAGLPSPGRFPRSRASLWVPIGIGLTVGTITIVTDVMAPAAAARGLGGLHVRGAASIPFYLYGAVLLTVVFHFLPVAVGAWLGNRSHGRGRPAVIAAALLLVAFSEDLTFFVSSVGQDAIETSRHVLSVLANLSEGILIYRFGLLAGLVQRGATYLLWHIAWPAIGGM